MRYYKSRDSSSIQTPQKDFISLSKLGEHPTATWIPGEVRNGIKVQRWELVDGQLVDG
jgi:hypothetical protein